MWFAALVLMFLSVESRQINHPTLGQQIRSEIYLVFEILGTWRELLATIGSWGDTLDDVEVLTLLKKWNAESSHADPKENWLGEDLSWNFLECARPWGFIQQSIAQIAPERQHSAPPSHIWDKRLPVLETRPNLVRQAEHGNSSSFAHRSYLHRKRHMSYNVSRGGFGKDFDLQWKV
jgi:hypothetical protein